MPLVCYTPKQFNDEKLGIVADTNRIVREYMAKGYGLTLRQLYYQFVARGIFPPDWRYRHVGNGKWVRDVNGTSNAVPNYRNLGILVSQAREAGLIDWNAIIDRSRASRATEHWNTPRQILEAALANYAIDRWRNQPHYAECWVEKEALEEIVGSACTPLDVRYFASIGYASASSMWAASQRILNKLSDGKIVHIIHLGDHDPSGIDMSRDIKERLQLYTRQDIHVLRIALNMVQVQKYQPPSDPAKESDSRFERYEALYGDQSWELDALDPTILHSLITRAINQYRDVALWDDAAKEEVKGQDTLKYVLQYFPDVLALLRTKRLEDLSPVICAGCGATQNNPKCRCDVANRGLLL